MKNKKLKKNDFIRLSNDQRLTQSVLRMISSRWNSILENPSILTTFNFTDDQLRSLASMNLDIFTKKAVMLNISKVDEIDGMEIRFVFNHILSDLRDELEQML